MIKVTRFDQSELIVNADLIEFIEQTPDTVLSMITGRKVLVQESVEEVIRRVTEYRQKATSMAPRTDGVHISQSLLEKAG
ncbi:MAG: flagellar FlbD family protein [Armatimonadetes bacterium]|nr:flagellar FlbD family protein [Armatimonadota bacterium]